MSPDPCHRANSTSPFSNSPESTAGRNLFKPVFVRISDFSRARRKINRCGAIPASASIIGRANSSKVTMVETGFPGRPKKYFFCGASALARGGLGWNGPRLIVILILDLEAKVIDTIAVGWRLRRVLRPPSANQQCE